MASDCWVYLRPRDLDVLLLEKDLGMEVDMRTVELLGQPGLRLEAVRKTDLGSVEAMDYY